MKKTLTSMLLIAWFTAAVFAQAPQFNWSTTHGGSNNDTGNDIVSDAQGNSYIIGSFNGTADFDPSTGISNLISNGSTDVYLMKLDNLGNLLWVKQIGGTGVDNALFIEMDPSGNLLIGGYFEGTVDFDPSSTTLNKVSNGMRDMFVSKFDSDGILLWVHTLGSASVETMYDGYVDPSGNIFMTGEYGALMDFDPTAGYTSMSCQGTDGFVLKLNGDGSFGFARRIGGIGNDPGSLIKGDSQGMIVVVGNFNAPVDFDNSAMTFNINPSGINDMYLLKLAPNGDFIWAGSCGGSFSEVYPETLAIGANNEIYVGGAFTGAVDLNPSSSSNSVASSGSIDGFVLKVDAFNVFGWSYAIGSTGNDQVNSIIYTASGDLLISGGFSQTVDFDLGTGTANASTTGGASMDVFLLGMDDQANFSFVQDFGGDYQEIPNSLYLASTGDLFMTGIHIGDVDMDPGTGVSMVYSASTTTSNAFVSKFSTCAPNTGTDVQSACFNFTWIDGNTYTSNNNTATYTLTNVNGCDSVVTLNLTVTPLPDLTVTLNGSALSVAANGLQYQWIDCNNGNAPITGATNQSFTPASNGSFAVIVTNGNCSETSSCFSVNTIGLNEQDLNSIKLYPNPTSGMINLSHKSDVRILSMNGAILMIESNTDLIDLSAFPQGCFIIEFTENGNAVQRERVVHQ